MSEAFITLQAALEPLGVEIGREVLAIWNDRAEHGFEALPASALKTLAEVIDQLLLNGGH